MSGIADVDVLRRAKDLFLVNGRFSPRDADAVFNHLETQKIMADGSSRRFWRLRHHEKSLALLIAPEGDGREELAESRSVWKIGTHLYQKGVPVPELFAWDEDTGILLCEDLGDLRLHDCLNNGREKCAQNGGDCEHYYQKALEQLVQMQIQGAVGLQRDWCWDNPDYDATVMVERESGYFLRAFWQGVMKLEIPGGVVEEFRHLAEQAAKAPATFFLHRDFQSRNIMIKDGDVRFIDFQAGRFGPLGYDLASLLIDPYVKLAPENQERLLTRYIDNCKEFFPLNDQDFRLQFSLLAVHRNLQIIGAFSFLSSVRGKQFFANFIRPALQSLDYRLEETLYLDYPLIRNMVKKAVTDLKQV